MVTTITATETYIYIRHHESAVVLPADDLADISAYLCFKKG